MATFESVFKMLLQAVFSAHRRLNAAFSHHGVAVADAQFISHDYAGTALGCR